MGDNLNDVNSLERELQALREQRAEAKERLDNLRGGRGRGRGPGSMGGRGRGDLQQRPGVFSRLGNGVAGGRDGPHVAGGAGRASVFDRLYDRGGPNSSRPSDRQPAEQPPHRSNSLGSGRDRADADVRPNSSGRQPITSRLSSRVVVPESGSSGQHAADNNQGSERQQPALDEAAAAAAAPGGGLKRLRSAVVVNGETRTLGAVLDAAAEAAAVDAAGAEPAAKRPALQTDAKTKIRAKRMFGNLLQGTLLKAKDENDSFKSSKAAQQRQEVERRAAQKAAAEDAKRREQEAQRREEEEAKQRQEREDQINRVMDLNLKSDIKVLEILYAKRIHRKQQLLVFCVTKSQPPIYWQPKQACEETDALLQEHAASFEEWKQQQLQQLEAEKGELVQRAAARRELAAARAAGAAARGEGQQQEEEQQEQEEGEAGGEDGEDAGAADGAGEAREEDMEDREAAEEAEEQQQEDAAADDEDQAADEQGGDQQQQAEEAAAARRSRRRQRGSDEEEEERLLSSEDEDD